MHDAAFGPDSAAARAYEGWLHERRTVPSLLSRLAVSTLEAGGAHSV
jgi:hypothetical protein